MKIINFLLATNVLIVYYGLIMRTISKHTDISFNEATEMGCPHTAIFPVAFFIGRRSYQMDCKSAYFIFSADLREHTLNRLEVVSKQYRF